MRQKTALALLAVVLAGLLCACRFEGDPYVPTGGLTWDDPQPTDPPDAELQELALVYYPEEAYNPYLSSNYTNRAWFSLIYQGLFTVDRNYEAHPMLCQSYWVSDDLRTYVFYLADATFSDGSAVTAEDVLASLRFAMDSQKYRGRFNRLDRIFLREDGGIQVELDTAYGDLPILLDVPILKASELEAPAPLGTGPYALEQEPFRLVRRTDWWCAAAVAATDPVISLVEVDSTVAVRDAFELTPVNLVITDPGSSDYVDYHADYELWECETGEFLYLACNMESQVFSVDAVRAALTHAIDRAAITEEFYHGFARPATLPASPLSPYYDSTLAARYDYDRERFRQAVLDAGLEGTTVEILVNSADGRRVRMARRIAEMLEQCGLVVEVDGYTGENYRFLLAIRDYDLHLGQTRLSPNMDLSAFFSSSGALNYGGIRDGELYDLCRAALADPAGYYELHRCVAEDGRLCPILFSGYAVYGERGVLTDLEPARENVFCYTRGRTMAQARLEALPGE